MIVFSYIKNYKKPKELLNVFNILFVLNLVLLIIAFFAPYKIRATKRWIDLYLFSIQPGELLKLTLPAFFVMSLRLDSLLKHLGLLLIVIFTITLLLLQPNLSNAVILFLGIIPIFVFNPFMNANQKIYISIAFVVLFISLIRFNLKPYHFERIQGFFQSENYQKTTAYQTNLVKKILPVLEMFGRSNTATAQVNFRFLPEKHNDFMFISLVFNFGKVVGILLLVLYLLTFLYILSKIDQSESKTIKLLLYSYFVILTLQTICSIAINLTLLPVAGITIPFLSYGGSSLLTFSAMLGMFLNPFLIKTRFLYE